MADATKIADALYDAGIIIRRKIKVGHHEWFIYSYDKVAEEIINNWRVAGKVLERWGFYEVERHIARVDSVDEPYLEFDITNPREIIEAWYEAQGEG